MAVIDPTPQEHIEYALYNAFNRMGLIHQDWRAHTNAPSLDLPLRITFSVGKLPHLPNYPCSRHPPWIDDDEYRLLCSERLDTDHSHPPVRDDDDDDDEEEVYDNDDAEEYDVMEEVY